MRLVTPQLTIDDKIPFELTDKLNRKGFAEALTNMITSTDDNLVISIDAPWGEGKTTFVKMWQIYMEQEKKINSIYFDAFANDFLDDPFIALSSEISNLAETLSVSNTSIQNKLTNFKGKAAEVAPKILASLSKIAVKAVTFKIVSDTDIEGLREIKDELSKDSSELISDYVLKKIESYQNDKTSIESFGVMLEDLAEAMSVGENKKIVFIIDELDRCKPTYAIEVIEKIKHIFSVKNVVFVLVMNKEQIESSIRSIYGKIDANTYLQKFITVSCNLPKNYGEDSSSDYLKYCKHLCSVHEIKLGGNSNEYLVKLTASLARHYCLSLRHLEKIFTYFVLYYSSTNYLTKGLEPILAFLVVTKIINSKLYNELTSPTIDVEFIITDQKLNTDYSDNRELAYLGYVVPWLRYCLLSNDTYNSLDENNEMEHIKNLMWNFFVDRKYIIPHLCSTLNLYKFS